MKKTILILLLTLTFGVGSSRSQVIINEVCSRNLTLLDDEDGDAEDWFELFNAGDSSIFLSGYHITDDASNLKKWTFPEITIDSGAFLILFASSKNRNDVIHHFESLIYPDDIWRYHVPVEEPDPKWRERTFEDSTWLEGQGGFGYGDGDDTTITADTLYSVYIRKHFSIEDTSKIINAILHVDYDDGFLAYINGIEVVRSYITKDGKIPSFNAPASGYHEAQMYQGGLPEVFTINKAKLKEVLRQGDNVLAIQAHSRWIDSDLSIIPWLSLGINDTTHTYRPLPEWFFTEPLYLHTNFKIGSAGETLILSDPNEQILDTFNVPFLKLDLSAGLHPDGTGAILFFNEPTPGVSNDSSISFIGISDESPSFSLEAGFYNDSIILTLADTNDNSTIRFTRDGSIPNDTSEIYSEPIIIDTTTVIRASCFQENYLSGPTITKTFLISENILLPAISLSTDPYNLWDWEHGIYVKGPNSSPDWPFWGANFWEDWEIPAHFEYFDKEKIRRIDMDVGSKIHGGWTRGLPMKSLKILTKGKYAEVDLEYKFFEDKNIESFKRIILRNAGNDFYSTFLRDATIHKLVQNFTSLDIQEYDPAIVFLNGSYWGIHNIREKIDRYWISDNYGISSDEVTLLTNQALVIDGEADEFLELIGFIRENDLGIENNFQWVEERIDLENFCDYMITEIHVVNSDWPHNNVKFWKSEGRKWRYFLLDVDASSSLFSYNGPMENMLEKIFADTIYYTSIIFNNLLENAHFREYFINRYADLMNTIFSGDYFINLIESNKERIKPDMYRHKERWGGSMSSWENYHIGTKFKGFAENRCRFGRDHIVNEFQLNKSDTLTVIMIPPDAGVLKINTIIPDSLPWTGIYFDSIPLPLSVIPHPGYEVTSWSTYDSLIATTEDHISFYLHRTDTLIVHLTGFPDTANIVFSEINYRSHPNHDAGDWVEIYNNESYEVDLGLWVFKDSDDQHIFEFPESTLIAPGDYLVLAEDTLTFKAQYPDISNITGSFGFGLSSEGEEIRLFNKYGHPLKNMTYSSLAPWPGSANGSGRTLEIIDYNGDMNDGTNWIAGCLSGSPGIPFAVCHDTSRIIVTEINYYPSDTLDAGEWIEIYNLDSVPVSFKEWVFTDGVENHIFSFPDDFILNPDEYLVITRSPNKFHSFYPDVLNTLGSYDFNLSNENDLVIFYDRFGQEIIYIAYDHLYPWPEEAAGTGRTLELKNYYADLNNGLNWKYGCIGGSPGESFSPCDTTAINDQYRNDEFSFYPNPVKDQLILNFDLPVGKNIHIYLVDLFGQKVEDLLMKYMPEGNHSITITPESINSGIYYLIYSSNKEKHTYKLMYYNSNTR